MKVAVVEYGMGNVDSVVRAVEECGGKPVLTDCAADLARATHIILPGVGSFTGGMESIRKRGLDGLLCEQVRGKGIPFLGICLGMQLLATVGWEGGKTAGLGWIPGEVHRLQANGHGERIPHVGWNEVAVAQSCPLFADMPTAKDFYFAHSYALVCEKTQNVVATTAYCGRIASVVGEGRIFGVQFHPEKSQRWGLQLIRNFLAM